MGIFNGVIGNASEINPEELKAKYKELLYPGEIVEKAYLLIRDMFIFTNKRLILVDVQGMTGKKIEYHSILYRSITHFTIETSGHFDLDAELKIWISGSDMPIQKQFNSKLNIYELQRVLAEYASR
ncbi:PH domain-containing protein [Clostridium polynesiense]|uniref:PH domain-containing protein n=1 Tax=Clostridium polynesiense TaxID=1325933 RepID=UPI00058F6BD2|nr:PH domain-containing protein [Clostridium polynesiense]